MAPSSAVDKRKDEAAIEAMSSIGAQRETVRCISDAGLESEDCEVKDMNRNDDALSSMDLEIYECRSQEMNGVYYEHHGKMGKCKNISTEATRNALLDRTHQEEATVMTRLDVGKQNVIGGCTRGVKSINEESTVREAPLADSYHASFSMSLHGANEHVHEQSLLRKVLNTDASHSGNLELHCCYNSERRYSASHEQSLCQPDKNNQGCRTGSFQNDASEQNKRLKHIKGSSLSSLASQQTRGTSDLGNTGLQSHIVTKQDKGIRRVHDKGIRRVHDKADITKGEERVKVRVVNDVDDEELPPAFHYIPRNLSFRNAHINISLARIGDDNCCSSCIGDCLESLLPCACAAETGGEFAYTRDGLVKKGFLNSYISRLSNPKEHHHFYCKDCPNERAKNKTKPKPCKGHLIRPFIKECWSKCGCNRQCGNRVVQRGITSNLQVFKTLEGKGWGLRTVNELPRGAFVCEYVGEIVTNMELWDRTVKTTKARHTYPVLLDADWGTEGVLKDEESLCLDATSYGNVARFINHRCCDANLVEIPVEVETPDHHYYHLAFFASRKIMPFEELTWDYGIDFSDRSHPIKAFKCCCRSQLCRDKDQSRRR